MTTRVVLTTLVACLLALGLARSAVALPATAIVLRPASVTVPVGAAVTFQAFQCSVDSFGNPQVGPDGVPGTRDDACTPGIFGWSTTIGRLLGTSGPTVGLVADAPGSGEVTASLLGLEGTALVTVVGGDTIPPTTTAAADPAPNAKGWNPTNVTVTLNAVDNPGGSGVKEIHYAAEGVIGPTTVPGSTASFTVTDEGVTTVTYFAVDNAGNEEAERTLELKIDKTNPTIDGGRTPLPNENGWNNTDVTVFVQASDEHGGSGIEKFFLSVIGENEVLLLTVGGNTGSVTLTKETNVADFVDFQATDNAGNLSNAGKVQIFIDKTPPELIDFSRSPPPNANGWNNTAVGVEFTAEDNLSGISPTNSKRQIRGVDFTAEGRDQSFTFTFTDLAGNTTPATTAGINIDMTPPTCSATADPSVLWPPELQFVPVTVSLSDNDALSGITETLLTSLTMSEPGSVAENSTGWAIGTRDVQGQFRAGRLGASKTGDGYTLQYTARDKADNTGTCAATVLVPHDQRK